MSSAISLNAHDVLSVHRFGPSKNGTAIPVGEHRRMLPPNTPEGVAVLFSSAESAHTAFEGFRNTLMCNFGRSWGNDGISPLTNRFVDIFGPPSEIIQTLDTVYGRAISQDDLGRKGELFFKKLHGMPISRSEYNE